MNEVVLVKKENNYEVNGVQVISTNLIAKEFDREHKHVIERVVKSIENEDTCFEEGKHYFMLKKSKVGIADHELFTANVQKEVYLLTERGFNKIVMGWRGKKADIIKEHILDVYFKAKEIHNQGITADYRLAEDISEMKQKLEYLTSVVTSSNSLIENSKLSDHDVFAPKPGGFYRKEVNSLVYKRAREKKKRVADVWMELYRLYKNQEGIDPVVMADLSGVGIIDYIAFVGKLNVLYDLAVTLCADRVYNEEVDFDENMSLDEV